MNLFKELYDYREMIFSLVRRDLRGRYKGSVLGFLWTFINPLLQLVVYTLVFSVIMRNGIEDFYLFLFVALVPWMFFGACVSNGAGLIWSQQDMVKKIYFPREVLPIAFATSQFINMFYSLLVVLAVLIVTEKKINMLALLFLPLIMIIEYTMALGVTFIASSVTVYFRDMEYLLGIITMAWQFLTPIFYSVEMVPANLMPLFNLNPMTPIIIAYRDILYYGQLPKLETLLQAVIFGIALLIIGLWIFNVLKRHFAEEL